MKSIIRTVLVLNCLGLVFGLAVVRPANASQIDSVDDKQTSPINSASPQAGSRAIEIPATVITATPAPEHATVFLSQSGYSVNSLDVTDFEKRTAVKRAVQTHNSQYRQCFAGHQGSVVVHTLVQNGHATAIRTDSVLSTDVQSCLAREFSKITFPRYDNPINLSYPLSFVRQIGE